MIKITNNSKSKLYVLNCTYYQHKYIYYNLHPESCKDKGSNITLGVDISRVSLKKFQKNPRAQKRAVSECLSWLLLNEFTKKIYFAFCHGQIQSWVLGILWCILLSLSCGKFLNKIASYKEYYCLGEHGPLYQLLPTAMISTKTSTDRPVASTNE